MSNKSYDGGYTGREGLFIHTFWAPALIGLGVGSLGTGIGSLLSYGLKHVRSSLLPFFISMVSGIVLCIILLEIFPEGVAIGGWSATVAGIVLGSWLIKHLERYTHRIIIISSSPQKDIYLRSGVVLSLAVAIHNFPTGVALGSSLVNSPALGNQLGIAMIAHNIPEGLAISLPLVLGKLQILYIASTVVLVALPTAVGTFIGSQFGVIWPAMLSFLVGLAIGTLVYVTLFEIVRDAVHKGGWSRCMISIVIGFIMALIFLQLL